MARSAQNKRDRRVTLFIHKLFWRALFIKKVPTLTALLFHAPAFFSAHVFIPLQVAFGIQAIFVKDIEKVEFHVLVILMAVVLQSVCLAIATWGLNRSDFHFLQRSVFNNYLDKDYDFFSNQYVGSLGAQASALRDAYISYAHLFIFQFSKVGVIVIGGLAVIAFQSLTLALVTIACMLVVLS